MLKKLAVVILLAQIARAQDAQPTGPPTVVADARHGIELLRDSMKNPDSFSVDRVYVNKEHTLFCIAYRAQNGFGGMNYSMGSYKPNGGINTMQGAMWCSADGWARNRDRALKKGWTDITAQVVETASPRESK